MDLITLAAAKKGSSGSGGTLTPATATKLGGVKVGSGLNIDNDGVLSASGGGGISTVIIYCSYNSDDDAIENLEYTIDGSNWVDIQHDFNNALNFGHSYSGRNCIVQLVVGTSVSLAKVLVSNNVIDIYAKVPDSMLSSPVTFSSVNITIDSNGATYNTNF